MLACWPQKEKTYKKPSISFKSFQQVDWLGAVLLLAASTLLVFALQEGGSTAFAWKSAPIISTLTISGLSWLGFFAWIAWLSFSGVHRLRAIFPFTIALSRPIGPAIMYVYPDGAFRLLLTSHKPNTLDWFSILCCHYQSSPALPSGQRRLSNHGRSAFTTPTLRHGFW